MSVSSGAPDAAEGALRPEDPSPAPARSSDDVIVVLERRIGYSFRDPELARSALTHRSTGGGPARSKEHNERLEFLGDSIVGLIAAEWLFRSRGEAPEGTLARLKSFLVSARALSRLARELGLGELLVLGQSEENTGGREKRSLIANAIEAVVGAIYLDGGLEPARQLLVPFFTRLLTEEPELGHQDVKTRLQELLQADGQGLPDYVVVERSGPAHEQLFVVECRVAGVTRGRGEGSSKKGAERGAAEEALAALLVAGASEGDAVRLARNPQS